MNGKINKTVSELGYQTGLKVRGTTAFGSSNGYLVCLCPVPATASYNLTIAFPHREDTYRVQLMNVKPMLKSIGAMGQSQVEPGLLHIGIVSKFKVPDAPKLRGFMDDVIRELSMITPRYDSSCENCDYSSADTVLVNGIPSQLCRACLDKLQYQGAEARSEFERATPNYGRGLAYGIGAMILSAVIYGLISYFTGYMFYFAGFIIGAFVGYAFSYGAEKITGGIIGLAVFLTIWAVIMGQVFFAAFVLMGEGISLAYLGEFLGLYLSKYPEDFLLTFVIGLIGAAYVAYHLWRSSKHQKPAIEITA